MTQHYDKDAVRKVTLLQFALIAVGITIGFVLHYFLVVRSNGAWVGLWPIAKSGAAWIWLIPGIIVPLLLVLILFKLVPSVDYLYDENVRTLADLYSLRFMVPYFLVNAFMEELIFRGALQCSIGFLPAAIIFTAVHISYYKKPLMLAHVFVLGLFIGWLFVVTQSLWICTIAHACYNWTLMWLIKTDRVQYRSGV